MSESGVANKTIIITGASRGIGAAAALHLAALGGRVVLAARSEGDISALAEQIRQKGGQALAVTCDVAQYADVEALVAKAREGFGGVDVLINNAGLIDPIARLDESDPAAWDQIIDVNVKGVYHGYRAALPVMLAQDSGGTVINISSGAATGALEGWSHYCASKAAVLSLTKCGHKEYGDQGIRFVGLSPGTVATEMQVQIRASGINPISQLAPDAHIPAEWVAQALAYLCGPGADAYLGDDFSLKNNEGRALVGLPPIT